MPASRLLLSILALERIFIAIGDYNGLKVEFEAAVLLIIIAALVDEIGVHGDLAGRLKALLGWWTDAKFGLLHGIVRIEWSEC